MTPHRFNRTSCACHQCVQCCKRQPGPLAPGDLERIAHYLGETTEEAKRHFCASPGAIIRDVDGKTKRVGTIVPKHRHGRCVFLAVGTDRCRIHPVAPFGCAMFDTHMSSATAMPRSLWLVQAQMDESYQALRNDLPYTTVYRPSGYNERNTGR